MVGGEDAALEASLRPVRIPSRISARPPSEADCTRGRVILSGRIGATPYAVFGGAMVVLGTIVALLLLLAAFIVWV